MSAAERLIRELLTNPTVLTTEAIREAAIPPEVVPPDSEDEERRPPTHTWEGRSPRGEPRSD